MNDTELLLQAVEQLGYRVTVGDVAAQAGMRIALVERQLLQLASASQATLQVSDRGDVVFQFSHDLRQRLWRRSWQQQLRSFGHQLWRILFYLIRISFGLGLLLSIGLFIVAIIAIALALSDSDVDVGWGGDSGGGGDSNSRASTPPSGGWIGGDWWIWLLPDWPTRSVQERPSLNFLEAIFSFLFGDGDPNADLEKRRWQLIGAQIRRQQGAVIAEQVVPYLDRPLDSNETELLPVLVRFDGHPHVSDRGHLLYRFPALQVTATETEARSLLPRSLQERPWRFSQASPGQIGGAIALGGFNLLLAAIFGALQRWPEVANLGGVVALVSSIYGVLLVYAIGFLTVPLLRWCWIRYRNRRLQKRNRDRQRWADRLQHPSSELQEKLSQLAPFQTQEKIAVDKLIYSSDRDLLEQEFEQESAIAADWQHHLPSDSEEV